MNKPRVYLAGGFYSGFDDRCREALKDRWDCLLPKESGLDKQEWFTPMDYGLIELSDAILIHLECSNPGRNCLVEIGYAKRAGLHIALSVEPGYFEAQGIPERYIGMAIASADFYTRDLDAATDYLNRYAKMNYPEPPVVDVGVVNWDVDFVDGNVEDIGDHEARNQAYWDDPLNEPGSLAWSCAYTFARALDVALQVQASAEISYGEDDLSALYEAAKKADRALPDPIRSFGNAPERHVRLTRGFS